MQDARTGGAPRRVVISVRALAIALAPAGVLLVAPRAAAWGPSLPAAGDVVLRARYLAHESNESYCPFAVGGGPEVACENGDKSRLPARGEAEDHALLLDAEIGLGERVALDLRLSYYELRFDDAFFLRRTSGFGDVTAQARFAASRGRVPVAPYLAVKIPVGGAMIAPEAIPVGEHQTDVEGGVHAGLSLWPTRTFAQARAAYRVRAANERAGRDPGNEALLGLDLGAWAGPFLLKAGVDRMAGERTLLAGGGEEPAKSVTRLAAGVTVRLARRLEIEAGAFVPVAGRNYPAGATYAIGASLRLSERRAPDVKASATPPPREDASSIPSRSPSR